MWSGWNASLLGGRILPPQSVMKSWWNCDPQYQQVWNMDCTAREGQFSSFFIMNPGYIINYIYIMISDWYTRSIFWVPQKLFTNYSMGLWPSQFCRSPCQDGIFHLLDHQGCFAAHPEGGSWAANYDWKWEDFSDLVGLMIYISLYKY